MVPAQQLVATLGDLPQDSGKGQKKKSRLCKSKIRSHDYHCHIFLSKRKRRWETHGNPSNIRNVHQQPPSIHFHPLFTLVRPLKVRSPKTVPATSRQPSQVRRPGRWESSMVHLEMGYTVHTCAHHHNVFWYWETGGENQWISILRVWLDEIGPVLVDLVNQDHPL